MEMKVVVERMVLLTGLFRVQRGYGIGYFFKELLRFVKHLLYSGTKAVRNEALKIVSIYKPIF